MTGEKRIMACMWEIPRKRKAVSQSFTKSCVQLST